MWKEESLEVIQGRSKDEVVFSEQWHSTLATHRNHQENFKKHCYLNPTFRDYDLIRMRYSLGITIL